MKTESLPEMISQGHANHRQHLYLARRGMRRFHESRIVLQLSWKKQGVILTVTSRKEEHHGRFRVRLTEEEQRVVNEERCCHPNLRIREKMLVLWLLHTGLTR